MSAPHCSTGRQREAGFSLVEMLLVLGILGLLATLVFPAFRGARSESLDVIAAKVQALLQQARTNALSRGTTQRVEIDMVAGTIQYATATPVRIPNHAERNLLIGQELVSADGSAEIMFFPDGSSTGAELALTAAKGERVTVSVPWLTGMPVIRGDR